MHLNRIPRKAALKAKMKFVEKKRKKMSYEQETETECDELIPEKKVSFNYCLDIIYYL